LIEKSVKEMSHYYHEQMVGMDFKARPDGYINGGTLFDLKTTSKIQPYQFERDIYNLNYDMRLEFYSRGLELCGIETTDIKIIAVENVAPYDVVVYSFGPKIQESGSYKYLRSCELLRECVETKNWHGVSGNNIAIELGSL
jgi:hypothetical protein